MDSPQVLQYVKRLPGVQGAFVADSSNQILSSDVPAVFDLEMLSSMAMDGSNALETLRAEDPEFHELRIDFDLMTILIRDLSGDLLFVLIDQKDEVSSIRIAANVVAKRYERGSGNSGSSNDPSSQSQGGLGFSLFGDSKPKPEKKKEKGSGGSIWG